MSSQGSSSVKVFSGATFAAFAGDPLSKEVSMPNISFTESTPEVASHLVDKGHLKKVSLWLTKAVELVDAQLEMGMITTVNGFVISAIFVFELILSLFVLLRYVKLQAARSSFARRSRARPSKPSVPIPADPASAPPLTLRPQQGDTSVAGLSTRREKRKRLAEFDPVNPPTINPKSLMKLSSRVAREAQAEFVQLERFKEIVATQPGVEEGYTLDADIVEAVKRLPGICSPWLLSWSLWSLYLKRVKCGTKWVGRHWLRLRVWCSW